MSPRFARVQRRALDRLLEEVVYLGRYAKQPFAQMMELPNGLRQALIRATTRIVKRENKSDDD